ncbi:hypothetical protein AAH994_07505 [Weeksellaceae bacterium A-14]
MKRGDTIRKILALHLAGLYAVLVIFSGKFHTHSSEGFSRFAKPGNVSSSFSLQKSASVQDCLVCQFNATAQVDVPPVFDFHVPQSDGFYTVSEGMLPEFVQKLFSDFYLRGPPATFHL